MPMALLTLTKALNVFKNGYGNQIALWYLLLACKGLHYPNSLDTLWNKSNADHMVITVTDL